MQVQKYFLINFSELEERFDPFFYLPEFQLPKSIHPANTINSVSYSVSHPPEYKRDYSQNGIQLIRAQNVRPTGLNLEENPVYFSEEVLKNKRKLFPKTGDVLVVRSGVNAGDTCTIEYDINNAIIGADNLLIKPNESILSKYIQVYFFIGIGRTQMSRYITGATNKHVNPTNLRKIKIITPSIPIQEKVVTIFENAVKLKNQKKEEAKNLLNSIDDYLLSELGIKLPEYNNSLENRIFNTIFANVTGNRWDPRYLQKYIFFKNLQLKYPITNLGACLLTQPQYGANEIAIDGNPNNDIRYIRITDIDELGSLKNDTFQTTANIETKYILQDQDLLFARSGSVGKCFLYKIEMDKAIYAGYLIRFKVNKELLLPKFVFYYTFSSLYKLWVESIQRPSVQANINSQEFNSLPIPCPSISIQERICNKINDIIENILRCQNEAQLSLEKAKKEAEKLILGEIE